MVLEPIDESGVHEISDFAEAIYDLSRVIKKQARHLHSV